MKALLMIEILLVGKGGRFTTMAKQLPASVVPASGIEIEDSVWGDNAKTPSRIVLNLAEDEYTLFFKPDEGKTPEACKQLVETYHAHGWKRLSELFDR